jgi:hypothetical protein
MGEEYGNKGCNEEHNHGSEQCHCGAHEDKMWMLMHIAKKAKMEIIKEKVKKKLEAAEGKQFDEVADMIVEAMLGKRDMMKGMIKKKKEMQERFEAIFAD